METEKKTVNSMVNELNKVDSELDSCKSMLNGTGSWVRPSVTSQKPVVAKPTVSPASEVKTSTTTNTTAVTRTSAALATKEGSGLSSRDVAKLKEMSKSIDEIKRKMDSLDELQVKLEMLDEMEEEINYIKHFLDTKLNIDFNAMYHNTLEQMNVEAIKIYRNLQAVIVEEDAKQNHVLFGVDGKSDKLKMRVNHVMIFSIVSFVVSILVILMQVLPALGINLL